MTEPQSSPMQRMVWGVAALLQATADALSARFGAVAVRGEVSGLTRAASGHCYFSLKDAQGASALIRCAMFRRAAMLLDFSPTDGQQVELVGRLGVYEPRGELQMVVEGMRRVGVGTLYEEFLRLRQKLQDQGLFDVARKRIVTREPLAVGVITSLGAAALHDVLTALARRAPHVRVVVYPSLVQGSQAPASLVQALTLANQRAEVDTLLLVRGGGALEDLWSFNDESVVRAVVASRLPVICGVGHETDISLCDLAADLRAPTPTAAAELAAPLHAELLAGLISRRKALQNIVNRCLQTQAQRVDRLSIRLAAPASVLALAQQHLRTQALRLRRISAQLKLDRRLALEDRRERLIRASVACLRTAGHLLQVRQGRLHALDPKLVLLRGYAWVETDDGVPVVSVLSLKPGQSVSAVWSDGRAMATIKSIET